MRGKIIPPLSLGLAILVAWEAACRVFAIKEYLLPTPFQIAGTLFTEFPSLLVNAGTTILEALIGFVIANVSAIALSICMVYVRNLDKAFLPFAIALKTTPIVAMAPLLLLWLGTGMAPKVASAALICFFPALVNSLKGFTALSDGEEDLFRVYGASKTQLLFKLRFQRAAPYIFAALKVSSSLAIVGAIVGEFVGANRGIGYVILVASYHLETVKMFAALVMSAAAGIILYAAISYLDRKLVFWDVAPQEEIYRASSRGKIERGPYQ
jgi:NitT/TauT family transport system permease protein